MIPTDHYIRFERVDSVTGTGSGLLAELHGEQLKIDIVSHDLVRIKISRGGVFDDSPTFAACVDPLGSPAPFTIEHLADRSLLITESMTVTVWVDPFRIDVHRADGRR